MDDQLQKVNDATFSASSDHYTISNDLSSGQYDRTKYGINYPYLFAAADKRVPINSHHLDLQLHDRRWRTISRAWRWAHPQLYRQLHQGDWEPHAHRRGTWQKSGENNHDQISVSATTPGATNNQNGQCIFTDLRSNHPTSNAAAANVALGLFDTYGEIGATSYTLFRGTMYEGFGQDQWRVNPKLVMQYGVRYSVMQPFQALWSNQSVFSPASYNPATAPHVDPVTGYTSGGDPYDGVVIPGSGFPSKAQGHVPASILSGGYSGLFRGYGSGYSKTIFSDVQPRFGITYQLDPSTVIRGGAVRFVQRLGTVGFIQLGGNAPFQSSETVTAGNVENPGGTGGYFLPLALSSQAYNFLNPNAWTWNLAAEREIPDVGALTLAYVGRRGLHLPQLANINQLRPGTMQSNRAGTAAPDSLRPYQGLSTILEESNASSSIYHGLQANLKRRLAKSLLFAVAYTWSKNMDCGSSVGYELENYYDPKANSCLSDFDIRHILVVNYVWNIPFSTHSPNRPLRYTLGNWQFSGVTQVQSGVPLQIGNGNDYAGVGPGAGQQIWDLAHRPSLRKQFSTGGTANVWVDPTAFVQPSPGTYAPRGSRNQVYGPALQSWNTALVKTFHVIPAHENHLLTSRPKPSTLPTTPTGMIR